MYKKHIALLVCSLFASVTVADEVGRLNPIDTTLPTPATLKATFITAQPQKVSTQRLVGTCPQVEVALTDSDFGDGAYVLQAGFAEDESFGATYAVPASEFPIRIDVMEALFGTSNALVETTTKWTARVWDGTPTDGILIASFSSDDIILPHLVMPPGTNGIILSVGVDPSDPEQIYIYNDSGMNSYSVAFRIDHHNLPGNPCISSPDQNRNAFPCTDTSGLQFPQENWIEAVTGTWCVCGSGWMTLQEFPGICTPSGDWVLRSAYTSINCTITPGACCFSDDTCQNLSPGDCSIFGGTFSGDGTACATFACNSGVGACCVPSTGNCVEFELDTCTTVGGNHMGEGTTCAQTTCFPEGACCLPSGSCIGPVTPDDCISVAGLFQGDATDCSNANCSQPIGACCGPDWCLNLASLDCVAVGGTWNDAGTACDDGSICDNACPEDLDGDGIINVTDLLTVVGDWGVMDSDADLDGNGTVDTPDLLAVIAAWGTC
ncbi:MAG: hypothetical protein CMJ26_05755 [Phycisphaerae bacterium]|nr:hypothetical protein [Phycisphaerae bacterium]|tara:strand:+ start:7766 stop:9241 length:1476 start_codon:yes stop_codon:yes gene_type:complete